MYSEQLEMLIDMTIEDGVITDKEKEVLMKRAEKEGVDPDELELYIQFKLKKLKQSEAAEQKKAEDAERAEIERRIKEEDEKYTNPVQSLKNELEGIDYQYERRIESALKRWGGATNTKDYDSARKECCTRKFETIKSAMVTTSRRDLLELLLFSKNLADPNGNQKGYTKDWAGWWKAEELSFAYYVLYENCVQMAMDKYPDDPDFKPYFKKPTFDMSSIKAAALSLTSNEKGLSGAIDSVAEIGDTVAEMIPGGKLLKSLWKKKK